jgi:hypothetical protein
LDKSGFPPKWLLPNHFQNWCPALRFLDCPILHLSRKVCEFNYIGTNVNNTSIICVFIETHYCCLKPTLWHGSQAIIIEKYENLLLSNSRYLCYVLYSSQRAPSEIINLLNLALKLKLGKQI